MSSKPVDQQVVTAIYVKYLSLSQHLMICLRNTTAPTAADGNSEISQIRQSLLKC